MIALPRLKAALSALLSHWWRHPGQLATLVIGLSLATALWSGVQAINAEARASYAKAEQTLAPDGLDRLRRSDGQPIALATYVTLQKAGWRTSPVIRGTLRVEGGERFDLLGVEPVTAPQSLAPTAGEGEVFDANFVGGQGLLLAHPDTADQLKAAPNLPPVRPVETIAPGIVVADIGVAARLLDKPNTVTELVLLPNQPSARSPLSEIAPQLERQSADAGNDIGRLTDSFHLNLTAFGLLSFAVGLFIVHGTIGLAFEQRRGVFRTLRVLGLSAREMTVVTVLELLTFALVAGTLGIILGYLIASFLLPDVAATLRGLYGATIEGTVTLRPQWWASGIAIATLGTGIAAAGALWRTHRLPILAAAQPRAWAMLSSRTLGWQMGAAILLLITAVGLMVWGRGLVLGFLALALLLVGAALTLPPIFAALLARFQTIASGVKTQWFWADTRQQVPGLSLALMALLLALAANIGVSTMVGSFRTTFVGWLDQRLAAEIYVSANDAEQAPKLRAYLEDNADAVLPIWDVETTLNGVPGQLYSMADHATYRNNWPLLQATDNVWDRVAAGAAVLINEQLSRRQDIGLGDSVDIGGKRTLPIAGVYSDYGNPAQQALISVPLWVELYPQADRTRFGVRIDPEEAAALKEDVQQRFDLPADRIVEQAKIKEISLKVFERTFSVTDALNILTLAVAGFAIFTSLLTLSTMRLPQLAPVWSLGITRRELAWLELARALILAIFTIALAVPVGIALAWVLLAVINVEAFGWRLPLTLFPTDWLRLALFALIAAALAAAIPARRLARIAPANLVKVFTHER
ncbi:MAG: ABC transporter permease [Pseudomonadota bacterium]